MQNKFRNYFRTLSALGLCLSVCANSVSVNGQTSFRAENSFHGVARDKAYAAAFRTMRGRDFVKSLAGSMTAADVRSVQDWLDLNNAEFFRALDTAFQDEAKKDFERRLAAARSGGVEIPSKGVTGPVKRKARIPRGYGRAENLFWETPAGDDGPAITSTGTDEGIETKGSSEKTKVVGGVTITQGAVGNMRTILVSGGNVGAEYNGVEYIEHVNKAERKSTRTETAVRWRIVVASCPDADGISSGNGTMTHALKKTITTPETIAVMTRDITTRMEIKGFVNDAAEFTYFDMKGGASESISGYDRAERLGLLEDPEFTDGTREIAYETLNNKPGPNGMPDKLGDHQGTFRPPTTKAEAERITEIGGRHIAGIYHDAVMFFKIAETHWGGGGCVEVLLTVPKRVLLPGEQIDVTAETDHKHEKVKLNADLDSVARATVSPEKQRGEPQATFTLTAPPRGDTAMIIVSTVSKRGKASEMIDFGEEKPKKVPPVKKPPVKKCDGAWSGTIKAVKTKRISIVKPADGRLVRQIETEEETFSIDHHVLGIADTSQGFSNGYFSDAQMNYRATKYSESNYAPGKMSCRPSGIITTPQTIKIESLMTALSSKRITVYITSVGEKGILTFGSPEVDAERIITRTYESACPSYNAANSGVDRSDGLIGLPSPGFEIEFELGPKSGYLLEGSKTIENSDGSETTVSWNLARDCK
jgi:hypothetical protein